MTEHHEFDDIIHVPTRLRTCSILVEVDEAEFGFVRDALAVSDSVMSKHVKVLENAGYVAIRKGTVDTRTRTWISLTAEGRKAFTGHVRELRKIAATIE